MSAPASKSASEFDPKRPLGSLLEVLREIFFSPKRFFVGFPAEGSLREPILFVLLVSAVSAVLRLAIVVASNLIFDELNVGELGVSLLQALAYVALSPVLVGLFAAVYLLSFRTFMGPIVDYRQVYRLIAYAYGALILLPFPVINAFAFTYAMLLLVAVGARYVYRASFLTALLTALVGYVPSSLIFITLTVYVTGLVFGR